MSYVKSDFTWVTEDLVNVIMGKCKDISTPVKQIIVNKYLSGQNYADNDRDLKILRNSI